MKYTSVYSVTGYHTSIVMFTQCVTCLVIYNVGTDVCVYTYSIGISDGRCVYKGRNQRELMTHA